MIKVIKKDGTLQDFQLSKVFNAIGESAKRAGYTFTEDDKTTIEDIVMTSVNNPKNWEKEDSDFKYVTVPTMHRIVERALDSISQETAKSYRDYRNYKTSFVQMLDSVYKKSQAIMYIGDKENANSDSALVSTKRSLIFGELNKELYQKFFLRPDMLQACRDGYIYIHDMSSRRDGINCFARNTSFLTENGIASFCDFDDGDEITVLTHTGEYKHAVVRYFGVQEVQTVEIKSTKTNERYKFTVTPNHRWILQNGSITTSLSVGNTLWANPLTREIEWVVESITHFETFVRNEPVWCLEVDDDHSFVLEGGIPTGNCCLFDAGNVLSGGFEMGNMHYNEPKSLDVAFDVIGDIILSAASQQYGGFTLNRIDEILSTYAKLTYDKEYKKEYDNYVSDILEDFPDAVIDEDKVQARSHRRAWAAVTREMEQGFQGIEYKLNTVASSRGDYPFTTLTFGVSDDKFAQLASLTAMKVRANGQGEPGKKRSVLFPKLVFLYTEDLHGKGKPLEHLFDAAIECSSRAMYPDYLSLDGDTTLSEMWHKYGEVIGPMGCVSGETTVQIKEHGILSDNIIKFSDLWKMIERNEFIHNGIHLQPGTEENLYADPEDMYVWDLNKGDYVKVTRIIRNVSRNWKRITFKVPNEIETDNVIKCTFDHPFPIIGKGRTYACDVKIGDRILGRMPFSKRIVEYEVTRIEELEGIDFSYDVTTESDRFMISGLDSHNCRAFLSPYYERGGMYPADENDKPFFTGRFNIGVVSLNLPMIYAKARQLKKDFYEVLDEYLELAREVHQWTYDYLGELRAGTNPLGFCEGGFHNGYLKHHEKIKPLLEYATASFGITALNELNRIHNKKSIREDGQFPLEVMQYINKKIDQFKKEDGHLYAIYGTPAESLCGKQVEQFRKMYGIVENVSDKEYVSNSFHCHVSEEMDGIEKQDKEHRFWNLLAGGRIQYVKYDVNYNLDAIKTYVRRAMKMGMYEGVNFTLCYCGHCGYEGVSIEKCPKCGSEDIISIERMNGYLAYSRVHGDTRLNAAKMAEIKDRKSM